jgi:hypothetical protein
VSLPFFEDAGLFLLNGLTLVCCARLSAGHAFTGCELLRQVADYSVLHVVVV